MTGGAFSQYAWLWMLAWQSTLCLAAGLGGSLILRRRPARAHQVLLIGLIAAAAIPALRCTVKQHKWGLFVERPAAAPASPTANPVAEDYPAVTPERPATTEAEHAATGLVQLSDAGSVHQARQFHPAQWLAAAWMVCALPWQMLLWWVQRRLVRLSEEACDDWVLACGQSGVEYAETLLDLTPQAAGRASPPYPPGQLRQSASRPAMERRGDSTDADSIPSSRGTESKMASQGIRRTPAASSPASSSSTGKRRLALRETARVRPCIRRRS